MAPSRLHGREPRQVTTYEYDDTGRLVRSVTVREPEWTERDLAEATALLALEAETCPGCGQPISESTHPDAEDGYEVDLPIRCHACTELDRARAIDRPNPSALSFEIRRTWTPDGR